MIEYKGVQVSRNSALYEAIEKDKSEKDPAKRNHAKKVFEDTTARFNKQFSEQDRNWFYTKGNHQ